MGSHKYLLSHLGIKNTATNSPGVIGLQGVQSGHVLDCKKQGGIKHVIELVLFHKIVFCSKRTICG